MPTYTFKCPHCGNFEQTMTMVEYDELEGWTLCNCGRCVHRDLMSDIPRTYVKPGDEQLKLGDLAKRNTDKFSKDYKTHLTKKHNEYKYTEPTKKLPKGMKHVRNRPE